MGAIALATAVSLERNVPALFVRKKAKEFGPCKLVEGEFQAGDRVTVIEDVVTSGGQVCQ
jgi:orotate phosphoribosyltransferase